MSRLFRSLKRIRLRRWLLIGGLILLLPFGAALALRVYSAWAARDQIYTLETVPDAPGGDCLRRVDLSQRHSQRHAGGSRQDGGGTVSAREKSRRCSSRAITSLASYNEPEAMRQYALGLGVPDNAIVLDYAGFRTYDSCYRARDIFKVSSAILVTQNFHLDRALLICNQLGIDSVGVAADVMRPTGYAPHVAAAQRAARIPIDGALGASICWSATQPTYLGDPLPILTDNHSQVRVEVRVDDCPLSRGQ